MQIDIVFTKPEYSTNGQISIYVGFISKRCGAAKQVRLFQTFSSFLIICVGWSDAFRLQLPDQYTPSGLHLLMKIH